MKATEQNDVKYLVLPPDMEEEYHKTLFSKIAKVRKTKDFNDMSKSLFIFHEFLVPNSKKDPQFAKLIKKLYLYLLSAKTMNVAMPYFMKNGLNAVILSGNPYLASAYFMMYGCANVSATFLDTRRQRENSKVNQTAIYKISLRVYKKLLELDL